MTTWLAVALFLVAAVGLLAVAAQVLSMRRHLAAPPPRPRAAPGVSILKPLCGLDDGLAESLATFARLDYPAYEVVLGVRSRRDPAWRLASVPSSSVYNGGRAGVAELADARDLKSRGLRAVRVRCPAPALNKHSPFLDPAQRRGGAFKVHCP